MLDFREKMPEQGDCFGIKDPGKVKTPKKRVPGKEVWIPLLAL